MKRFPPFLKLILVNSAWFGLPISIRRAHDVVTSEHFTSNFSHKNGNQMKKILILAATIAAISSAAFAADLTTVGNLVGSCCDGVAECCRQVMDCCK
jgi:hypothetical protein